MKRSREWGRFSSIGAVNFQGKLGGGGCPRLLGPSTDNAPFSDGADDSQGSPFPTAPAILQRQPAAPPSTGLTRGTKTLLLGTGQLGDGGSGRGHPNPRQHHIKLFLNS